MDVLEKCSMFCWGDDAVLQRVEVAVDACLNLLHEITLQCLQPLYPWQPVIITTTKGLEEYDKHNMSLMHFICSYMFVISAGMNTFRRIVTKNLHNFILV